MNKIYENEQMFQEVNERMARATAALTPGDFPKDFVLDLYCECVNKQCHDRISIAYDEYTALKEHSDIAFVVGPEHYLPEFEKVVKKTMNYWIIIKRLEKLSKQFEV